MTISEFFHLSSEERRRYRLLRAALYLVFAAGAGAFVFFALFPRQTFTLNFSSVSALKNTLFLASSAENVPKVSSDETLTLIAPTLRDFSHLTLTLTLNKKSSVPENAVAAVRRSYQSFLLPVGEDASFSGEKTDEKFPGGSLVSYGGSVFAVDGENIRPVADAETFSALGYQWRSVIPADAETVAAYEKTRVFTLGQPHPDGTIFETESGERFEVRNKKLHPTRGDIPPQSAVVSVRNESRTTREVCRLAPVSFLGTKKLRCDISLDKFPETFGSDIQMDISFAGAGDVNISRADATLTTTLSKKSARATIDEIRKRVLLRFGKEY